MKQKILFLALINFLLFSIGYTTSKGTTTASFLKIAVGARNIAMGETGATSGDINSIYWNPAGLASIDNIEASLMHSVWLETINYEHLTFGLPTKFGNIGFAVNYLFMGEMDKYDYAGDKQGSMTAGDLALTLGYSRKVLIKEGVPYLKFGANIKYLHSKLEEEKADALATDLGLQTELKNPKVKVGLVIQNVGTDMKFVKESYPLPTNIKLGAGYSLIVKNNPLNLAFDINIPNDNVVKLGLGAEYEIDCGKGIIVSPRIGYGAYTEGLEGLSGITAGMGFKYQNYFIDYAFVPYGQLGNTHRISLSMEFKKEKIEEKVEEKLRKEEEERIKEEQLKEQERLRKEQEEALVKAKEEAIREKLEKAKKVVCFGFNSAKISPVYYKDLIEVALYLKTYSEYKFVEVDGHTCSIGSAEYNEKLSLRRAKAVAEFFIKYQDIPQEKIVTKGYGESMPVASNKTPQGRAKNRRAEVIIKY